MPVTVRESASTRTNLYPAGTHTAIQETASGPTLIVRSGLPGSDTYTTLAVYAPGFWAHAEVTPDAAPDPA